MNWIQWSTQKKDGSGERRACRKAAVNYNYSTFLQFYDQQEEDLNQKSPRVIDHFVFKNLTVDNVGQTADNKNTGSIIFSLFLWQVKPTSSWEMILFKTSQ